MFYAHIKKNKGFTLIEVMVVITIFILVSLMLYFFASQSYKTWDLIKKQGDIQEQVRNTINRMTQKIRKTQTAQNGAYPIKETEKLSFIFYANIDSDPDIEKIRYFLEETDLKRGITKPTGFPPIYPEENEEIKTIAFSIRNTIDAPIFSYFDENYKGAGSPLSYPININLIKLVRINLIIDKDTEKNPPPYILESEVNLRNLKTNL